MYKYVRNQVSYRTDRLGAIPKCPEGDTVVIREKPQSKPVLYQYRTITEVKNNPNKANGCGIEGGAPIPETFFYESTESWLLVFSYPVGKSYSFTQACNNHDICYGKCNSKRKNCDNQFLMDMHKACNTVSNEEEFLACFKRAAIYHASVTLVGDEAYQKAQDVACEWKDCCKS